MGFKCRIYSENQGFRVWVEERGEGRGKGLPCKDFEKPLNPDFFVKIFKAEGEGQYPISLLFLATHSP